MMLQKTECWAHLMSLISQLNMSVTDNIDLMTPEIHDLMSQLVRADIDRINFTTLDVMVCFRIHGTFFFIMLDSSYCCSTS